MLIAGYSHGNLIENAPLFLIMLFLTEMQNALTDDWLRIVCVGYVSGRIAHGIVFSANFHDAIHMVFRFYGTFTALLTYAFLGYFLITTSFLMKP